ncbi:LiaI-LiaF-like domain-containing protein [Candidatus Margulisiibacteriota bacterium]
MIWGYIFLLIGVAWILQYYNVIPKDFEFFWPVIFIALGLSIILGKKCTCGWDFHHTKGKKKKKR